jgi:AraC-like DNA-binding protein
MIDYSIIAKMQRFELNNIDDVQSYMSEVLCPHRLKSGTRSIDFMHSRAHMRDISFHYMSYGMLKDPIDMYAPSLGDSYILLLNLSGLCELRQGRKVTVLEEGALIVGNTDTPAITRMHGDYRRFAIKIPKLAIERVLAAELGYFPTEKLRFDLMPIRPTEEHAALFGIVQLICNGANGGMMTLCRSRTGAHLERALICAILSTVESNFSSRLGGNSVRILPYYLKKVMSFIDHHVSDPIALQDMVDASGVSTRSLHASFRKFLDTSPMAYLRNYRLDLAKKELLLGNQERTVTEVALDCGFTHLSKFASDFRQRFGVLPSQLKAGLHDPTGTDEHVIAH